MSHLISLQLKGIRSYHPNPPDAEKQTIEFTGPLTLITGANGSGKTTIIESLKYATMGECPNKSKKEFIHDPHIWGIKELKAEVRLRFKDIQNNNVTVIRGAQSTVRDRGNEKDTSFKSIMNRIETEKGNDVECVDLGIKEVEGEIPRRLGVPNSILEHVIFCHQEDSCWPIDLKPKDLKERFDELFGAERYDKATKAIKDKVLDFKKKLLSEEMEARTLNEQYKHMVDIQNKINKVTREIEDQRSKKVEAQKSLEEAQYTVDQVERIKGKIEELKHQIALKEEISQMHVKQMKAIGIDSENIESEEKCKDALGFAESELQSAEERLKLLQNNIKLNQEKFNETQKEVNKKTLEHAKLQTQADGAEVQRQILAQSQEEFVSKFQTSDLDQAIQSTMNEYTSLKVELENMNSQFKEEDKRKSAEIDASNKELQTSTVEMSSLQREKADIKTQVSKLRITSDSELNDIQESLNFKEAEYKELTSQDRNQQNIQREIDEAESKQPQIQQRINELEEIQRRCDEQADLEQKAAALELQISKSKKLRDEHFSAIVNVLGDSVNQDNVQQAYKEQYDKANNELKNALKKKEEFNNNLTREKMTYDKAEADQKARESNIEKDKQLIYYLIQDQDFNEAYKKVNQNLNDVRHKIATEGQSEQLYLAFRAKAKSACKCPLCKKELANEEEQRIFDERIEKHLAGLPTRIKKAKEEEARYTNELNTLNSIRPTWDKLKQNEIDYKNAESEIASLRLRKEALEQSSQRYENDVTEYQNKVNELRSISASVEMYIRENKELSIAQMEKNKIAALRGEDVPPIAEVKSELKDLEKKRIELMREKERLTKEILELSTRESRLQNEISELRRKYDDVSSKVSQKKAYDSRLSEIEQNLEQQSLIVSQHKEKKEQLMNELNQIKEMFSSQIARKNEEVTVSKQRLDECHRITSAIKDAQRQIEEIESGDFSNKIAKSAEELKSLEDSLSKYGATINQLMKNAAHFEDASASDSIPKLKAEIELGKKRVDWYKYMNEYTKAKEEETKLQADLNSLIDPELLDKYETYKAECSKRNKELAKVEAILNEKESLMKEYTKDATQFNEVPKKLSRTLVTINSYKMSVQDLEKYAKQLDDTLLEYHSRKMAEINESIRSMWDNTYHGNDIDYICIKAEAEKLNKNKTYNYRVTMRKDGIDLDMSNRCSAGQKMLASLIIRLALAETFAQNCGIIALDEPTTNLDISNVENFANELNQLIRRRAEAHGKKFQMIIITHSQNFVNLIAREGTVDHFYQVTKETDGGHHFSQIKKCDAGYLSLA